MKRSLTEQFRDFEKTIDKFIKITEERLITELQIPLPGATLYGRVASPQCPDEAIKEYTVTGSLLLFDGMHKNPRPRINKVARRTDLNAIIDYWCALQRAEPDLLILVDCLEKFGREGKAVRAKDINGIHFAWTPEALTPTIEKTDVKSMTTASTKDKKDLLTIKAVILYILKNCSAHMSCNVYYIVKVAFLAQQKHLAKYLCPLYEDKIVALQFGPVPSNIYDALKIARGDANTMYFHRNDELHLLYDSISFSDEVFSASEEPDMNYLSPSAIECINEALKEVSKMTFDLIVNAIHGDEWNRAYNNPDSKSMSYLAIAREGGADESSISYLKENLHLDCMLK